MRYWLTLEGETVEALVESDAWTIDGARIDASISRVEGTPVHVLRLGDSVYRVHGERTSAGVWRLEVGGRPIDVDVVDDRTQRLREMTRAVGGPEGPQPIKAPMPGLVLKVDVSEGDVVEPGQGIVIVEAMKMENELRADVPARVVRILVTPGDTVAKDQVMIELGSADDDGD